MPNIAWTAKCGVSMRCCVRCHAGPATQAAYVNLLAAALSASPVLQQSGSLVQELHREPEPLDDGELQQVASSSVLLQSRPYLHTVAARLWQWRATGAFPRNPEMADLAEDADATELYGHLTPLLREAVDAPKLAALLEALGPWGVLALLGCRRTPGTLRVLPPAPETLATAFTRRHSPSAPLTVGARALAKHVHRSPSGFWANGATSLRGSDFQKNAHALKLLEGLLRDAVWMNIHALPGGSAEGQSKAAVFELRQRHGYGARWSADGQTFRGFVEPQAWDIERRAAEAAEAAGEEEKAAREVVTPTAKAEDAEEAASEEVEGQPASEGAEEAASEGAGEVASQEVEVQPAHESADAVRLVRTLGLEKCCNAGWLTIAGCAGSGVRTAWPGCAVLSRRWPTGCALHTCAHTGSHPTSASDGSLMDRESAQQTSPSLRGFRYGWVEGYSRVFNLVSIINIRRGLATGRRLATCTARPRGGCRLRVCLYEIPVGELPALYAREARLRLSSVEHRPEVLAAAAGHALMCTEYSDAEYRRERAPLDEVYEREVGQHYRGRLYRDDLLPVPSYLYRCAKAHALAGDAALGNFLEASFLGDGTTSLRAYLSRELRAIEEDAALAAATGWDLSSEETSELRAWMRR